jgi:hypothetical protein
MGLERTVTSAEIYIETSPLQEIEQEENAGWKSTYPDSL